MATSAAAARQYYVIFMTTSFRSLADVRATAPAEMDEHLARSRQLHADGVLLMAGAFLDRPEEPLQTMGVLASREAAEDYARQDPFVRHGMVTDWTIREWANMLA
ncbi:MAG: YciI family protein [Mycobacteriales bacterium]